MSNVNKIPGNDDTIVTLTYEDHHEGWHSTGELEEDSVGSTDTVSRVTEMILDPDLKVRTTFGDERAIDVLRDNDYLEEYERGSFTFEDYVSDTIAQNFMELDSLIECSIEQYDHKRGKCTVSTEFTTTLGNLKESPVSAIGWTATVEHDDGEFSINVGL